MVDAPAVGSGGKAAGRNLGAGLGTTAVPQQRKNTVQNAIALFLSLQFPRRFTYYLRWEDGRGGEGRRRTADPPSSLPSFKRKGISPLMPFDTSHL